MHPMSMQPICQECLVEEITINQPPADFVKEEEEELEDDPFDDYDSEDSEEEKFEEVKVE